MIRKDMLKKAISNKLFSVEFIKADKTKRKMLCKLPTDEKFFAGGELLGNREHLLEVLDVNILKKNKDNPRKAWRSINLTTLTSLKIRGIEWI
jgi:hypothetical protein|tara:strand:+ start:41 stop:319 length:279 start_codon:yes stop_codon:yes gene_type:complete